MAADDKPRIPPIVSKGYQAKGEYKTINGLKTCKFPWSHKVHPVQC